MINYWHIVCRRFVDICKKALDMNSHLISRDQTEYHESLTTYFDAMTTNLSKIFGEPVSFCTSCNIHQTLVLITFLINIILLYLMLWFECRYCHLRLRIAVKQCSMLLVLPVESVQFKCSKCITKHLIKHLEYPLHF